MKRNKNEEFNKLILRRKIRSTLRVSSIGGKNKQIQVEVRKRRTYIQYAAQKEKDNNIAVIHAMSDTINEKNANDVVSADMLIVDKKSSGFKDVASSSKILLQKNSDCSEFVMCQQAISDNNGNHIVEKKMDQVQHHMIPQMLSQKHQDHNQHKRITSNSNTTTLNNVGGHIYHDVISSIKKDNNRKVENERRNRARIRMRYKSSSNSKLIKHKRNNNYRLHDLVVSTISDDSENREREQLYTPHRLNRVRRSQQNSNALVHSFNKPTHVVVRDIIIGETISVAELANKMSVKGSHVIELMMKLGLIATINQIIDQETAQLIAEEMGHNVVLRRKNELEELIMHDRVSNNVNNEVAILENRAPIVTIMGHVDHGKTSLLDYIRTTKVAATEVGGITQSIGAYHVNTNNGMITFIDTPGHAVFTSMRIRGAQLTDIVVLVIAADDGVMPQTVEAIKHAKSANVPILVAINKIDKVEANPERIYNELNQHGVISEKWGGDVQFVSVSAISGKGIDNLLDAILLQSEMLELKVMHHGMASAIVIDSFIDKGRGPIVTVLVREGTLKCGDVVLCGTEYGRVRAMRDEYGNNVISVGPSIPVELLGLSGIPMAGENAIVVRDEKKARDVALYRQGKFREMKLASKEKVADLESVLDNMKNINAIPELPVIIKTSTQSFLETIRDMLMGLSIKNKIVINILSSSVGDITETDTALAVASNAIILGFNVRADLSAKRVIDTVGLDVRYYSIIYDLLHAVKKTVQEMLEPRYKYQVIGVAEVRNVFCSVKHGNIAGCIVIKGLIKRDKKVRVIRNDIVVYNGELSSLRHFKNDVSEVKSGMECGIGIKNYTEICSGDIIEVFDVIYSENMFIK